MKTDDDAFVRIDEVLSSLKGKDPNGILYGGISFEWSIIYQCYNYFCMNFVWNKLQLYRTSLTINACITIVYDWQYSSMYIFNI